MNYKIGEKQEIKRILEGIEPRQRTLGEFPWIVIIS
jgi:hypothetical protein